MSSDLEKNQHGLDIDQTSSMDKEYGATEIERVRTGKSASSEVINDRRIDALTPQEQKKVIRRIDRRLVLTLGFMYCVSLMDRTNLGVAVVGGMGVDLVLVGSRYSIITLVFFLTYTLLQPPATVVMRKIGPKTFLPTTAILWGMCTICFGFVKQWDQMVGLRLILGVFEAGFFPGCAYLLSTWYPRYELQKRNAVFYLIGSMASAFSGILAFGFTKMNKLGNLGDPAYGQHYGPTAANPTAPSGIMPGIAGWRWIFIMQGVLTVVIGAIGLFTIVDFPEKAATKSRNPFSMAFLSEKEAAFVVARIERDRHDAIPEAFNLRKYIANAADIKIWGFASLFGLTTTQTYAIAFFLPQILEGMGFTAAAAQCLIAPPYVLAAIVMYTIAAYGDRLHLRGPFVVINALVALIGLCVLAFTKNVGARYFGVFLAVTGCNSNIPTVLTYQANNIRGQWKRALASATLVGFGGIGGIIGSTVFRSQDAPGYIPGMIAVILASVLIVCITGLMSWGFVRANKRAERGECVIEGLSGFRYTL